MFVLSLTFAGHNICGCQLRHICRTHGPPLGSRVNEPRSAQAQPQGRSVVQHKLGFLLGKLTPWEMESRQQVYGEKEEECRVVADVRVLM